MKRFRGALGRVMRVGGAGLVTLVLLMGISGCSMVPGGSSSQAANTPRPLTDEEAYRLASVRFQNFNAGTRKVNGVIQDQKGTYKLSGWLDFAAGSGLAAVQPDATADKSAFLVSWTRNTVAFSELPADGNAQEPPDPALDVSTWQTAPLDPRTSALAKGLSALLLLAADRPENPLLLQQGSALWIASEDVNGVQSDIFTGPAPSSGPAANPSPTSAPPASSAATLDDRTKYWVDDTGILRRFDMRLAPVQELSSFTFEDAPPNISIPKLPETEAK